MEGRVTCTGKGGEKKCRYRVEGGAGVLSKSDDLNGKAVSFWSERRDR